MPTNQGFLIFFDEAQRSALLRKRADGQSARFSDALSLPDWKIGRFEIGLLAFTDSTINCVALLKRGKQVVTEKARVEFSDLVLFQPVRFQELESKMGIELQPHLIATSRGVGSRLPDTIWTTAVAWLKKLRPEAQKDIDRLVSLRSYSGYEIKGGISKTLVQEREALGSALDIFSGSNQLREKVLRSWAPPSDAVIRQNDETMEATLVDGPKGEFTFLSQISKQYRNEESALQHDLFSWDGIQPIHVLGRSLFIQGRRKLEVIYANQNPLEKTLGVDLIYCHREYGLFALVQYKMMRQEGGVAVYRPDKTLERQIRRMDDFVERYGLEDYMKCHRDFRMNSDGFLFKLIPQMGLKPASGELIPGIYLTREYMKFLLGPDGERGDKNGRLITFKNTPRHLTNSDFVLQIRKGWLGMRGVQSELISTLLARFQTTGRAVLFAHEQALSN